MQSDSTGLAIIGGVERAILLAEVDEMESSQQQASRLPAFKTAIEYVSVIGSSQFHHVYKNNIRYYVLCGRLVSSILY